MKGDEMKTIFTYFSIIVLFIIYALMVFYGYGAEAQFFLENIKTIVELTIVTETSIKITIHNQKTETRNKSPDNDIEHVPIRRRARTQKNRKTRKPAKATGFSIEITIRLK